MAIATGKYITAAIILGVGAALLISAFYMRLPRDDRMFTDPEFDEYYQKYQEGKVEAVCRLPFLGGHVPVSIVDTSKAGAVYGFATSSEPLGQLFVPLDGVYLDRYDDTHVLVIIDEGRFHDLERQNLVEATASKTR